ncbi:MAG: carbamoyltransferase HypF [Deltaproteobacteria bacterium]|nr:carbamoyltransferase HypF [Deltaproteobacteria bacterium]
MGERDSPRWRVILRGVVQGIGFRPFVYHLAHECELAGSVRNTAAGVEIDIEGPRAALVDFVRRVHTDAPALARITAATWTEIPALHLPGFHVLPSQPGEDHTLIPPDLATCSACIQEISDLQQRRFRYPFTNCTRCGPRFTVVCRLPYDRAATTLADFSLCPACVAEYHDPADRRFHAEPIACATCGPRVWLETKRTTARSAERLAIDAIAHAAALLRQGAVLAVKGLGGFHLVCDATNAEAVQRLRGAKQRRHKPLAVMVATVEEARMYSQVSADEATLLLSVHAPIVLVRKQRDSVLAAEVAPGTAYLGVMLPYTPLHHVFIRDTGRPLVVTSGNRRDDPLCLTAEEAHAVFRETVDGFLLHDRPIQQRCDDSVCVVTPTGPQVLRRARGYVPLPVRVPLTTPAPILAVGAELKNTFCLLRGDEAFLSQHLGDMGSVATRTHFTGALAHLTALLKMTPTLVAHDLHPDYATSRFAATTGLPLVGVQHHHAHIASCLADNGLAGPVIGVAFDGTGYGTDGAIWGGEFVIATFRDFRRVAHLEYLPLPGGEAAIRHPHRIAIAYLLSLLGTVPALPFLDPIAEAEQRLIRQITERRVNTPLTSSCGRLFDAVAALVGPREEVTYEAQAAIELESVSYEGAHDPTIYPYAIDGTQIRLGALLARIVADVQAGVPVPIIGWRFHQTLAEMVREVCLRIRAQEHVQGVALSGGCWQNRLLLDMTVSRLRDAGFLVYTHKQTPTNDGGISLGQAVVAAARHARAS